MLTRRAVVLGVCAAGSFLSAATTGRAQENCPARAATLARNGTTAVIRLPDRIVVGCNRIDGSRVTLSEQYLERVFLGPAIALKRSRVAYSIVNFEDPDEALETTSVFQLDLAAKSADGTAAEPAHEYPAAPLGSNVRVTRMILRSDGAMAWIACTSTFFPPPARTSRDGECDRPGRESFVMTVSSSGRRSQVERSKAVDPQYLRLADDGRFAYRAGRRTVTARLR